MHRGAAAVADQEDAVVQAARVAVRDEGIRALDPAHQIVRDEQVEDPVNAVRRDALSAILRNDVGDFIGARGLADLGDRVEDGGAHIGPGRSEEHTSELQSLMRISYAVFCLKKKKKR